jgi:hypothetical protein
MDDEQPTYFSYLLRVWRGHDHRKLHPVDAESHCTRKRTTWLASVESSLTGKRQGFASLEDLFAFLRRQTGAVSNHENREAASKDK